MGSRVDYGKIVKIVVSITLRSLSIVLRLFLLSDERLIIGLITGAAGGSVPEEAQEADEEAAERG